MKKHYWLCADCAKEKGGTWPDGHVATVMVGECPYCKVTTTIIPWVDFNWKNQKEERGLK